MKTCHTIGLALSLIIAACSQPHSDTPLPSVWDASPELAAIDSMMWQRPDSALVMLLDYLSDDSRDSAGNVSSQCDVHYAQLLAAELLYKNDYEQTNRKELLQAVAYFDNFCPAQNDRIVFLDARAHYINGVGYYEHDSVVEACTEYIKALETMEGHCRMDNLAGHKVRFMSLTNNRLVDLFSAQFMQEPAIICAKQSLLYDEIEPNSPYNRANILYRIGLQYDKLNKLDSASFYYEASLNAFPDRRTLVYRDLIASRALLEYNSHRDTINVLDSLKSLIIQATDEAERLARMFTIGAIYYMEEQYDSAKVYLIPVYEYEKNETNKKLAAERLRKIAFVEKDSLKVNVYSQVLVENLDTEASANAQVSCLENLFNNYLSKKKEKHTLQERSDAIWKTGKRIIAIAIVLGTFIITLMKYRNRKKVKKIHDTEKKRHTEVIEAERQAHNRERSALSERLKRSNRELRKLKEQIKQQENLPVKGEQATSFTEEPIYLLIMERVREGRFLSQMDCKIYKEYALEKEQLSALRNATDRHFEHFTTRISKAYPELTRGDLDYCCLYLLGLSDADIAALMQRAYNTVNERSNKLKRIFGNKNALPITLQAIANGSTSF